MAGVLVFPDAGGVRATFGQMGDRLAGLGYVALVPDIYYRAGEWTPFDVATLFTDPRERARMSGLVRPLTNDAIVADARAYMASRSPTIRPTTARRPPGTGRRSGGCTATTSGPERGAGGRRLERDAPQRDAPGGATRAEADFYHAGTAWLAVATTTM